MQKHEFGLEAIGTQQNTSKKIAEIISKIKPDYIFHLAAQPLVALSYQNPLETFQTNVIGTANLLEAIKKVFDSRVPHISSTKSLSGHSLGAAGVHESIYTLLMMNNNFICESANIDELDKNAENMNIVKKRIDGEFETAMSNSFGFGGTNASLVFKKYY